MGTEHLTKLLPAVAIALAGCPRAEPPKAATEAVPEPPRHRHMQIVRAALTKDREAVFARFRERNGEAWAPIERPASDVDPIRLVVRRAARRDPPGAERDLGDGDARSIATAFVRTNVDLLGVGADDVEALDVEVVPDGEESALARTGRWAVRFTGKRPMRGYEGFDTIATTYDLTVVVGRDGAVRLVANESRIHPRLSIDTKPVLGPDDARLLKDVVGRELFVVVDDPRRSGSVRELRRVSVGRARQADVRRRTLHVHVSVGPMAAYVAYHLAYAIDVDRADQEFRFIVDADTGDLLEDAVAPVVRRPP